MNEFMQKVASALTQNGFEVYITATAAQARQQLLALIAPGQSIGIGGSMTIRGLNVIDQLEKDGHPVYWHWTSADEREVVFENARKADVYLASSNAVTRDGQLVNIDGTANRVGSMIQGPKTLILVVGQQKLVDGGLTAAIARIKRIACPANARRLGLNTPCGRTGVCNPAECGDDTMCRVTTVISRPPRGRRIVVILTEEEVGF